MKDLALIRFLLRHKAIATIAAAGCLIVVIGAVAARRTGGPRVPTADVKRGEFVDYVQIRGEIKALRSVQLTAPSIAGDLQIVKLVRTGTMVKAGDVVVKFDTSTLETTLAQKKSELKSAEADIEHSRAENRLQQEQQATDVLQGRYDVDRAKLDTSQQEILSEIDGAKTRLKLTDAEQKFKELQQKDTSTKASGDAEIASKKLKRDKALFDVRVTEKQIASLTLRAPSDGMVTIMPNFRARNWMNGSSTPDFKEGDRAWGGAVIAELPDLSVVRASARVDEGDRGRLNPAQTATVRIDAIADKEFHATVAEISPLAKVDYSSWPFTKNFDIAIQILDADPRIRPGMSASGRIAVEKIADGILVPPEAVFERNGGPVAYVLHGSEFEERPVQVARRAKGELLIGSGLQVGDKVALKDPMQEKQQGQAQ
ncbi:MAG TPA: HlyD family efflux transporter periplasmic adaptor subunit [Candidatus Angelobacter sp.]|nr:HlyD family efflux transporter periplasmic adaptor subunit [Candidatus Angelobacter sp.]